MNYRPDEDAHYVAKRRQYIKRRKKKRTVIVSLICIAIAIVWVMILCTIKKLTDTYSPAETVAETSQAVETTAETVAETESGSFYANAETLQLDIPLSAVNSGSLVLVSDHLCYSIPEKTPELVTVWGNKSATYYVASSSMQIEKNTFALADKMFSDYYAATSNADYQITMGYYDAEGVVCCGEHSTGYAFDVNVYKKDGTSMRLAEACAADEMYSWLYDHAAEYGFVLRYGKDKTGVTGMAHDPDHFRYVGAGHAQYMTEKGLSLEEYIGVLQKYPYEGEHLEFSYGDVAYEVFYVKVPTDAESVLIDVPSDVSYTLSGDNICGVVVTLYK